MKEKYIPVVTTSVFVALIFGFAVFNIAKPDKGFSDSENRYLAQRPKFSVAELLNGKFTTKVETYITDQFIGRDEFIGIKTQNEYLMGKKDTKSVYFAKDGYLIERYDKNNVDVVQLNRNLEYITTFINKQAKKLGNQHVTSMLVPTTGQVLEDKLPPYAPSYDQLAVFDSFKAGIPQESYVDVAGVLNEHRDEYIFYKTDHHWTSYGAYYAYRAFCDKVGIDGLMRENFNVNIASTSFYGTTYTKAQLSTVEPDPIYSFVPKQHMIYSVDYDMGDKQTDTLYDNSFLNKRDKYSYFLGGNHAVVKINSSNKNGKSLLVVRDSYGHSLAPFLANDFENVYMVDLRYYNASMSEFIDDNDITDVMVLYSFGTIAIQDSIIKLTK